MPDDRSDLTTKSVHQLNVLVIDHLIGIDRKIHLDSLTWDESESRRRVALSDLFAELRQRALADMYAAARDADTTPSAIDRPGLHNLLDAEGVVHARFVNHRRVSDLPHLLDHPMCAAPVGEDMPLLNVNQPVGCRPCLDWREFDHGTALAVAKEFDAGLHD
jgi:hypothetical protein